jgi:signal transduction histidine kinase
MIMELRGQTILLVSEDAGLREAARKEFECRAEGLRVAAVSTVDAARRVVEDAAPAVILLEETSLAPESEGTVGKMRRLDSAVSSLAVYAPVVVIGAAEQKTELSALVSAGAADFVTRGGESVPAALACVDRRVRQAQSQSRGQVFLSPQNGEGRPEAFGEILRHELNNPLTGILGNAELLLAEVRRTNDGRLPSGGQQRLETIAALAVRLRETVRRLSQELERQTQHR